MYRIEFQPGGEVVRAAAGTTLLEAARQAGKVIEAPCAGGGTCGKCKVRLTSGTIASANSRHRLAAIEEADGWVLACAAEIQEDLVVELAANREERLRITSHGREQAIALQPWIRKRYAADNEITRIFGGATGLRR